ncbi:MAG: ABC transporter ATP-binding protein [Eubacteriales bacterium]|nr:ABC transporter ATP-binding protein [Eubacteriales bacterium]
MSKMNEGNKPELAAQSSNAPVIQVCNVEKKFRVYYDKGYSLKDKLVQWGRNRYQNRYVLRGVSMDVQRGEAIGIIGENGCGKSTMLKMLTRIMYPDAGSIQIKGRISSLIELGAGFHPDLSGRENIYTNASIFGLTRKEINERMEDIVEFSELGEYLDNPIRTYSSGMYMRLAFSIAINVDADVLLIDEILAVGDANFQTKCFSRLRDIKATGTTIAIVSHDLGTIQTFCDKALWLSDGKAAAYGNAKSVVESYRQYMNEKYIASLRAHEEAERTPAAKAKAATSEEEQSPSTQNASASEMESSITEIDYNANRFGLGDVVITRVTFRQADGQIIHTLVEGEPTDIDISYAVHKSRYAYNFGMGFYTPENVCLYGVNTQLDGMEVKLTQDAGFVRFHMDHMPLLAGHYYFQCAVNDINGVPLDYYRRYMDFDVSSSRAAIGCIQVDHQWEIF